MAALRVALALLIAVGASEAAITMPTIFKNGMVLQGSPIQANIYGTTDSAEQITVNLICSSGQNPPEATANNDGSAFNVLVGPIDEGDICSIVVSQSGQDVIIDNVLFADVYICSGQSNMRFTMEEIYNATEEIANSASYTNIRMYDVEEMTADTEQEELLTEAWDTWYDASDAEHLGIFSAVCFLTARSINEQIGSKPFGLIGTNWGGTRIEAWSPPESLDACNIEDYVDTEDPKNTNSALYNAMIHPLTQLSIKGFMWYQGEANTGWNMDFYDCTQREMINAWRQRWNDRTTGATDIDAPFGLVQLADNDPETEWYSYPIVRWKQTGNLGYTPNENLDNVWMAVALDTHDVENGIHPRDKQIVGYRMSLAALNVVYGDTSFPMRGPRPRMIDTVDNGDGTITSTITFDSGTFTFNPVDDSGFYLCSLADDITCDATGGAWDIIDESSISQPSPSELSITVASGTPAIAYLWKQSPILTPYGAPIYADDQWGLPAAPFKFTIVMGHVDLP